MTQRQVKDVAASVRDRIRAIHRRTGLDYNPLMTRYYQLAQTSQFNGPLLQEAILNTFHQRGTRFLPDPPSFRPEYFTDPERQRRHWSPLVRRVKGAPVAFADVVVVVRDFLLPIYDACARGEAFSGRWDPEALSWLTATSP